MGNVFKKWYEGASCQVKVEKGSQSLSELGEVSSKGLCFLQPSFY